MLLCHAKVKSKSPLIWLRETAKLVEQVMEWQKQTNPKPLEIEVPNYAIRFALYK